MFLTVLKVIQEVAPSPDDFGAFLQSLVAAFASKDWRLVGGMACILVVWGLRRFLSPYVKWFSTARGGAVMALLVGLLGSAGHMLMSKSPWSVSMLTDGLVMAITAAGGWTVMKKLISKEEPATAPAPAAPPAPPAA